MVHSHVGVLVTGLPVNVLVHRMHRHLARKLVQELLVASTLMAAHRICQFVGFGELLQWVGVYAFVMDRYTCVCDGVGLRRRVEAGRVAWR